RAMADCRATRGVLDSLIARHWPDAPPAVEDLINVARQFNPEPIPLEALPDDLVAALRQSSRLWIEYESSEGAVSQRWIEVRSAAEAGGKQYLVAFCEERQAERHFRLDRICTWKSDCPHPPAARVSIDREYTVTADGLLIRPLQEEELAALPDLWIASGLTHKPKGRDKIKNLTKQYYSGSAEFFGAFVEGRLVGSVIATDDSRRGWINRLAVHPDYRGRDIARALIHSAEEHFRGLGIKVLDALIDADNAPSRRLFTSEGYVEKPDILYFTKRPSRDA
ncbi:MAG: GNAT family N-acetyltransferase, partial [Candidatus Zixiibacteriota bacterium]